MVMFETLITLLVCDTARSMLFHNRCPLIVEPKDYQRWLSPAERSHLPIDLVRTYPAEGMKAWRVAKLQGNGPHLLQALSDPPQTAGSLFAEQWPSGNVGRHDRSIVRVGAHRMKTTGTGSWHAE